jgi:hypothetical protein
MVSLFLHVIKHDTVKGKIADLKEVDSGTIPTDICVRDGVDFPEFKVFGGLGLVGLGPIEGMGKPYL